MLRLHRHQMHESFLRGVFVQWHACLLDLRVLIEAWFLGLLKVVCDECSVLCVDLGPDKAADLN